MTRSILPAAVLAAGMLAACSSVGNSVTTAPASTARSTVAAGHKTAVAPVARPVAHVGSSIALKGMQGDALTVTLVKVAPTTTATDGFSAPAAGSRYFAAQFRLTNSGTGAYSDSPYNAEKALDSSGQQFNTEIVSTIAAGPMFPATVSLAPGGAALGWMVFQVPAAAKITGLQFGMDSGMGNAGEWKVP